MSHLESLAPEARFSYIVQVIEKGDAEPDAKSWELAEVASGAYHG